MTDASGTTAPGYNERCQTRASIVARWILLVPACAMPLALLAWNTLSAQELVGVAAGVAMWTAVMIRLHVWRLAEGDYGETSRLTESAGLFMVFQWLFVALTPPVALFVFYSPATILVSLVLQPLTLPDPVTAFLVTVACGCQVLASVLALSWAIGRRVRHLNGPR